jgi:predicted lipoprotein with Yx(FWY)xxD motif
VAATGPKIASATVAGLGPVLVDASGRTLYIFVPDHAKKVTCTGGCAAVWPPATVPSGDKAAASGTVKQSLLGSDPDPSGGQVITYAGWPLYRYVADSARGMAAGQAINLNGGLWYVISPSGKVIKAKPSK